MCRASDEIDAAVAHDFAGFIDRKDMLQLHIDPFFLEVVELNRGNGRKIRIRDEVGDGDFHDLLLRGTRCEVMCAARLSMPVYTLVGCGFAPLDEFLARLELAAVDGLLRLVCILFFPIAERIAVPGVR